MSSNSEHFPENNDKAIDTTVNHTGRLEDSLAERPVREYTETPLDTAYKSKLINIPETPYEGFEAARPTQEEKDKWNSYNQPNNKSKKGLFIGIGSAAAGAAIAVGTILGLNANKGEDDNNQPPAPQETASAPATPGAVEQPEPTTPAETAPAPVASGELVAEEDLVFYTEDGSTQTYEELVDSLTLPTQEYSGPDAADAFFASMNQMIQHMPSPEEVRHNLNIPDSQEFPTFEQYEQASIAHGKAFDILFESPSGDLYEKMHQLRDQALYNWVISMDNGDEVPYELAITYDGVRSFKVTDNAQLNSFNNSSNLDAYRGTYQLDFNGEGIEKSDFTVDAHWHMSSQIDVTHDKSQ